MDPNIEQFLLNLPDQKRELAMQLREIVLSSAPSIKEALKWKQLTFVHGKTNIAFIYTYAGVEYINLGFFEATSLTDPKNLFEGTGKGMRHIKIRIGKDIPASQVKKWVKEAIKMNTVAH